MIPDLKSRKIQVWVDVDTRSKLYGLKSQYPNLTFDGIINKLIDRHGVNQPTQSNPIMKKKDPFWGRY